MKKYFKYYWCFLISVTSITSQVYCQIKKQPKKKHPSVKQTKSESSAYPVFKTQEEATKWIYEDSSKSAKEDSILFAKDSIESENELKKSSEEFFKVYQENHYPKDSLSYVDEIVASLISANDTIDVDNASYLIAKRFRSSLQQARAIFSWIASTVQYDHYSFSNNLVLPIYDKKTDAANTFKNKIGVCQNYSNLYQYMCEKVGLESKLIFGWGKNFPFCINGDTDKESNHAWNCVKTNIGWVLLDATWATIDTTHKIDNYWFNTPPGEFIYNHLPEDSSLQLLKLKISKKQFSNFPIVSNYLFKSKIDFEVPEIGRFILTGNKFSITIPETQKNYAIGYSIMPYKGIDWRPYIENMETQTLDTKSTPDKKNRSINYETEIPTKGVWWLSIDVSKKIKNKHVDEVSFPEAIIFKITYK